MSAAVGWGVAGCGWVARDHALPALAATPGARVVALHDRDPGALARVPVDAPAHADLGAFLATPGLDAVYVAVPNAAHREVVEAVAAAGKAVLCEKPLASNAHEARQVVEAALAAGRPLIEAFHYRHHPVAKFVEATLRSGALGRLRRLDARLKIGSDRLAPDNIRFQSELAGGATMDLGAYCINLLRLCVGEEPSVEQATPALFGPGVDLAMEAQLQFPGGAQATFACSLGAERFETGLTVEGEHGALHCDNPFLPRPGASVRVDVGGESRTTRFDEPATYVFQARALARVIRDGAPNLTSGTDGIANMEVIDAVYRKAGMQPRRAAVAA